MSPHLRPVVSRLRRHERRGIPRRGIDFFEPFCIDSVSGFHYSESVRWLTILIGIMVLTNVVVPRPGASPSKPHDGQSAFVMLDVCHSSVPQASEDDDMPTVAERSDIVVPAMSFDYSVPVRHIFIQFLFASQNGRPPEV